MPNFFCEYCGIYLKHSSPFGRKQHAKGKKHIHNKVEYYQQFLMEFQQQEQPSHRGGSHNMHPGMPPHMHQMPMSQGKQDQNWVLNQTLTTFPTGMHEYG